MKRRIYVYLDSELIDRVRRKHPELVLSAYIGKLIASLDDETPLADSPTAKKDGIGLTCPRCGHSWTYTGAAYVTRCARCGKHVRTGVKVRRNIH